MLDQNLVLGVACISLVVLIGFIVVTPYFVKGQVASAVRRYPAAESMLWAAYLDGFEVNNPFARSFRMLLLWFELDTYARIQADVESDAETRTISPAAGDVHITRPDESPFPRISAACSVILNGF